MIELGSCLCALALELTPGVAAERNALDSAAATELAALIARDLVRFDASAAALDLAVICALFDPAELLRPHWPLHRELEHLVTQAPGVGSPRIIAFAGQDGDLPASLQPQSEFQGSALRLLPLLLRGEAALAAEVAARLEHSLLDLGMAGADTALMAQQAFGARIEHARYLTVHDLMAMMALQYEHAGLAALWPLLESALLTPQRECWLDAAPEPLMRLVDGQARIAMLDDEAWAASALVPISARRDADAMGRAFERFQMRQRQLAALLEAHGVSVTFDHCPLGRDPREVLRT
ncbi:MAG: hypothetical protein ABIW30_04795 [Arenimonas sp.]